MLTVQPSALDNLKDINSSCYHSQSLSQQHFIDSILDSILLVSSHLFVLFFVLSRNLLVNTGSSRASRCKTRLFN
jgi:hypothetical protein